MNSAIIWTSNVLDFATLGTLAASTSARRRSITIPEALRQNNCFGHRDRVGAGGSIGHVRTAVPRHNRRAVQSPLSRFIQWIVFYSSKIILLPASDLNGINR